MKADYHFHPNLHCKRPEKRLTLIWQAFQHHELDAVICTEHTYKNAPDAYRQLVHSKPEAASTHVFPGVELISREGKGIEIIAFAKEDWYDHHRQLLMPMTMGFGEIIDYLERSDLYWFIPHPFLIGNPLLRIFGNTNQLLNFLHYVPSIEVKNGCYEHLRSLIEALPLPIAIPLAIQLQKRSDLRFQLKDDHDYRFLAVGSDAHHPEDIGLHVDIPTQGNPICRESAFKILVTNCNVESIHLSPTSFSPRRLIHMCWTTFSESCMKREWRRYQNQHWAFNTAQPRASRLPPNVLDPQVKRQDIYKEMKNRRDQYRNEKVSYGNGHEWQSKATATKDEIDLI